MGNDYYIRRDRSALARGDVFANRRRRSPRYLIIPYALAFLLIGTLYWQQNAVKPMVMAAFGVVYTPTPTILESAKQGDLAFWRGDLEASIKHYRAAAALATEDIGINYQLARMLIYYSYEDDRRTAEVEEAVQIGERLSELAPNSSPANAISCFALIRAGRAEEAVQVCNRAINLDPDNAEAYAYLAQGYFDLERFEDSGTAGQRALQLDPRSIEANTAYGLLLFRSRQADAGMQYFIKAAETNKRLKYPYFNLAINAFGLGLARGDNSLHRIAISAYETILAMDKRNVQAYTGLCRVYFSTGERNLARDNCFTATELDPGYTLAWRWLGEINYLMMQYEESAAAFEKCAEYEKDLPNGARQVECWALRGLAYVQSGQCTKAMPIFTDVLNWTRNTVAIERVNKGIRVCSGDR
jgi:tetratricopeptide (TPR) repeat protein